MDYGNAKSTPSPREATVTTSLNDLDPVIDRIEKVAGRLWGVHERVNGPSPSLAATGERGTPTSPSIIGMVNARRQRLVEIADGLETVANGIDNGL